MYRGFIFDLDGTIIDSKLDFDAIRSEIGMTPNLPILEQLETYSPNEKLRAMEIIDRHEIQGAKAGELIEGFLDFYQTLLEKNLPRAIQTRNSLNVANESISKYQLEFYPILSRDCAPPKPNPAGALTIIKEWDLTPEEVLYIGDSHYDLKTAMNTGCHFALISATLKDKFEHPSIQFEAENFYELEKQIF